MKVLVLDNVSEKAVAILKENGIEADVSPTLPLEELCAKIPEYEGMIVRSQTKVTAEVIAAAKNMKVIGRAGVGVDNVDVNAATRRGIIVMNAPDGNTISTAEHTVAMIMALARNVPQAHASLKEGRWDRKLYTGVEVNGKTSDHRDGPDRDGSGPQDAGNGHDHPGVIRLDHGKAKLGCAWLIWRHCWRGGFHHHPYR